jgi:hypothetical protein
MIISFLAENDFVTVGAGLTMEPQEASKGALPADLSEDGIGIAFQQVGF